MTHETDVQPVAVPEAHTSPGGGVPEDACKGATIVPGRVTLHRLNRAEYDNTVRDLLADTSGPAKDFPPDDHGYGFDNNADVLSVAPLLVEKYAAAAETLVNDAWARDFTPGQTTRIEAESATQTIGAAAAGGTAWNLYTNGSVSQLIPFVTAGQFTLTVRAWGQQAGAELPHMDVLVDNVIVASFDVAALSSSPLADQTFTKVITVTQGSHNVAVEFTNDFYDPNNVDPTQRDRNLIVDWFEVKAPGTAAGANAKVRVCDPATVGESACGMQIVTQFSRRAWRRNATPAELDRLMGFLTLAKSKGDGFEVGMKLALEAILLSPHFIYRVELDQDPASETPHRLNDFELATRLSYFLWSSTPDDQLLALAESGALQNPQTVTEQVDRMLEDPRAQALVENFGGQWLETRKIDEVEPSATLFPSFGDELRGDLKAETQLFFQEFLKGPRPVRDMLDADFTFMNDRLANHYGLPEVGSATMKKVTLNASTNRGGLLRHASFLTLSSNANRTSPVKRGKWVLEKLLCKEPPPPPPGVENIEDNGTLTGSFRQRMEAHMANPKCSGCHALMDPIGFGFENFDAIGKYRTMDGEFPVDATGALPNGAAFNGPSELAGILKQDENLSKCVAKNMLVYALGRGNSQKDECTLQKLASDFDARGGTFKDLIHVIAQSEPFTQRQGEPLATGGTP